MHPAIVQCNACLELCRGDAVTNTRNTWTISYSQDCKRVTQVYRDLPPLPVGKVPTHEDRSTAHAKGKCIKTRFLECIVAFPSRSPCWWKSLFHPTWLQQAGCWGVMGSKCTARLPGCFAKPAQSSVQRHNRDKLDWEWLKTAFPKVWVTMIP